MDLSFETDFGNESNTNSNSSAVFPPLISENTDEESLFHLLEKIKETGILELFSKLSANSRNCVIAYIIMFLIGAPGNLYVVISVGWELWKTRFKRSSRIRLLIWHLAIADLFVTFVVIPVEIFWRMTNQWYGGNSLCKFIQFLRTFGLYLSSMMIICISIDRFFAIVFPLRFLGGMKRIHKMLFAAWTCSLVFASPQIIVFSVERHPLRPLFPFCTNSNFFSSFNMEILYNVFSLVVMYFAPLIVIIVTYALVFFTISKKSREQQFQNMNPSSSHLRQTGNVTQFMRAKSKAMWVSMLIVTVFVICWTPFVIMTLWYMFDFETAERLVDPRIREALFVTALSNSCLNPIIYGNYMRSCFRWMFLCLRLQVFGDHTITLASTTTPGTSHHINVMNSSVGIVVPGRRITSHTYHL